MTESIILSFKAGADLSAKQYYFVELDSDGHVTACNGATDKAIGVLQNDPTSGQAALVCVFGRTKVSADAALSIGDLVGTSADGQADAKTPGTDTSDYVKGIVTKATANAGEIAEIILLTFARGA